jgi:oligopeptide transport system substrate-binding protein
MRRTNVARFGALVMTVALAAAACGSSNTGSNNAGNVQSGGSTTPGGGASSGGAAPVTGGTFVDLQNFAPGAPAHIDPALASELSGAQVATLLYDSLTEYDFTNREQPVLKPNVAESFSNNDDATVFTFKVRKDVKYSDGTQVMPSDFKYAWEQVLNPDLASDLTYLLENIKGAKDIEKNGAKELSGVVADDAAGTLVVTLEEPFADFAGAVSHPVFSPKPKAAYSKAPADWEKTAMIGNGPFKMKKAYAEGDQQIELVRNDAYFGGIENHKAYLDEVDFKISKDIDSAYNDFEGGNGQNTAIPSGKFAEATGKYPHATEPNLGLYYFAFNQEDPVVGGAKNLKLRQAISLGIDRQGINKAAYDGSRRMPSGVTPPGLPGFKTGLCGDYCPENPQVDKAKQLVSDWKAAGGSLNGPIKIQFNAGAGHEDVVNVMVANLKDIGIEAEADPRDSKTYFKEMRTGGCVFCRAGWIWDYPIYDNGVNALLNSASIGGDNLARFKDDKVDKAIADARKTTDATKRAELYQSAERGGLDAMATMPVNWYAGNIVYTEKVQNYVYTPLQFTLFEDVWLKS